jgi:hypothetical protein
MRLNPYTLALFAHVSGAIGVFVGLGAFMYGIVALRRARRVEEVRVLAALTIATGNIAVGGIVVLGIAGFYMALTVWGVSATWIIVATISFILLAPWGMLVINPRIRAITKQARQAPDGALPQGLTRRIRDPLLGISLCVYIAWLFGIVFLMTNKPATGEAIVAMLIALAVGLLASAPFWRSRAMAHETQPPVANLTP